MKPIADRAYEARRIMREAARIVNAACIVSQAIPMDTQTRCDLIAGAMDAASIALSRAADRARAT